jgi:TatD DNase family protein
MKLIDTHTHLYLPEFDPDRDEVIARAVESGVVKLLMPNIDAHSVSIMQSIADRYPAICYPMIGLHPTSVKEDWLSQIKILEKFAEEESCIAIGEIGIDLYWDKTFFSQQQLAFRYQIALAISLELPVVIHSRESMREVFDVLEEFRGKGLKGVMHAFTGSISEAEEAIGLGLYLGIGGISTFKNSLLDITLRELGPDHIVLETDSPYLAPVPYRGKRNESAYLRHINKKLSEIFGISEEEVARITYANSVALFNLG